MKGVWFRLVRMHTDVPLGDCSSYSYGKPRNDIKVPLGTCEPGNNVDTVGIKETPIDCEVPDVGTVRVAVTWATDIPEQKARVVQ